MKDEIQLVIDKKDRDYFMERNVPFPLYWYGYKELPKSKQKSRAYSVEMRELSDYPMDYLEVVEMFWGMTTLSLEKIRKVNREFVENIPVPTPTRINALVQTKLSMISSEERKEWADRVEGKAVSREVSMSLVSDDSTSTSATRELILSKFEELGSVWSSYADSATKKLVGEEQLKLEAGENTDGETEG